MPCMRSPRAGAGPWASHSPTIDRRAYPKRDQAMAQAYASGLYAPRAIAAFFGVHYMTVSRVVRKFEELRRN